MQASLSVQGEAAAHGYCTLLRLHSAQRWDGAGGTSGSKNQ